MTSTQSSGEESPQASRLASRLASRRRSRREIRRAHRRVSLRTVQWPMVVWLTLLWWVLWGSWTALSLASGVLVAVLACLVFPLPPLRVSVRIRPLPLVVLLVRFLADVVVASVQVASTVIRPPAGLRSAIVRVPLRTDSDLILTAVAEMVSLVPGSVVVEAHRPTHTLYLHALDVSDEADLQQVRARVLAQEERIVAAFAPAGGAR